MALTKKRRKEEEIWMEAEKQEVEEEGGIGGDSIVGDDTDARRPRQCQGNCASGRTTEMRQGTKIQ